MVDVRDNILDFDQIIIVSLQGIRCFQYLSGFTIEMTLTFAVCHIAL